MQRFPVVLRYRLGRIFITDRAPTQGIGIRSRPLRLAPKHDDLYLITGPEGQICKPQLTLPLDSGLSLVRLHRVNLLISSLILADIR